MDNLVQSVATIIAVLVGYFIGRYTPTQQDLKNIIQEVPRFNRKTQLGAIRNPTQIDILKKTDPKMRIEEEEKEAMRHTLDKIVEMK